MKEYEREVCGEKERERERERERGERERSWCRLCFLFIIKLWITASNIPGN
jgi:hypothetical protein